MDDKFEYKEPQLLKLDAVFVKGTDEWDNASGVKFEAGYEEEEHETIEL